MDTERRDGELSNLRERVVGIEVKVDSVQREIVDFKTHAFPDHERHDIERFNDQKEDVKTLRGEIASLNTTVADNSKDIQKLIHRVGLVIFILWTVGQYIGMNMDSIDDIVHGNHTEQKD